jgi:hypothetical protein
MDAGVARRATDAGARQALMGVMATSRDEQVKGRAGRALLNIGRSQGGEGVAGLPPGVLGIWRGGGGGGAGGGGAGGGGGGGGGAGEASAAAQAARAAAAGAVAEPAGPEPAGASGGGGGAAATAASIACCAACGGRGNEQTKLLRCARCKAVRYCGPDCQRAHWRTHRRECAAPQGRQQRGA